MDGKIDLERIAHIIRTVTPDLVALQEVDKKTRRVDGVDQATVLGKLTGMNSVFGKAIDFSGGEYGNAVLSRFPLQNIKVHLLPYTKGNEARAVLQTDIQITLNGESQTITFCGSCTVCSRAITR